MNLIRFHIRDLAAVLKQLQERGCVEGSGEKGII